MVTKSLSSLANISFKNVSLGRIIFLFLLRQDKLRFHLSHFGSSNSEETERKGKGWSIAISLNSEMYHIKIIRVI